MARLSGGNRGRTEAPLLCWFADHVKPGSTWLDVGGHYGYTAIALGRLAGSRGRDFTFEPIVATAGCVAWMRALNQLEQLTVVPQGLGVPETMSTVRLPMVRGLADSTIAGCDGKWCGSMQVVRFDWLWSDINGGNSRIDGVKIDVQGMEFDVLAGMRETLAPQRPTVALEFHRGVDRRDILALLDSLGYTKPPHPIEPHRGEGAAGLLDDRSYAFYPGNDKL